MQPKILRDAVAETSNKRELQLDDMTEQEKLKRKMNIISLAKSMVSPRPDTGETKMRVQPDLAKHLKS